MTARALPDDELALLGQSCREFFAKAGGVGRVRELRDGGTPHRFSAELWGRMAELGWLGIPAPEAYGGAGGGCQGMLAVQEVAGAVLAPEPLLSSVLAVRLLALAGTDDQRRRWLAPIMAGVEIPAVVGAHQRRARVAGDHVRIVGAPGAPGAPGGPGGAGGPVLEGSAGYVLDGALATVLLVLVEAPAPALVVLPRDTSGVRVHTRDLMDLRNWAAVAFEDARIPAGNDAQIDPVLIERALDEAGVGLAGEMLGAMWSLFDRTLEHVRIRHQFGRPIGAFQALQHRLARLYADLLLTDACVREAARALDDQRRDAAALASAAKVRCVLSSRLVCREGIQLHGGMGVTDECDVGLFVKNLRVAEFFLGDLPWHTDRWASLGGY